MYLPPQFASDDRAIAVELMRAHPFASLITLDADGLPFVTHLPFVVAQDENSQNAVRDITLLGHCAKPNPAWRHLAAQPRAVVSFVGPHAYMSPTVYPDLMRVPTWNYLAVDATVEARLIDSPQGKARLLKALIAHHEPAYADQWRGLGEAYQLKMLAGIVGFELRVMALQCKIKLNQHRPEAHAAMRETYEAGTPDEQALASWMTRLGMALAPAAHEES